MIYQTGFRPEGEEEGRIAFVLETKNTSYIFAANKTGQLEHLYYGAKIRVESLDFLFEKHYIPGGNLNSYDQDHLEANLEDISLEVSGLGKGDIRDPFVELMLDDGSTTTDFIYTSSETTANGSSLGSLPSSYNESGKYEHLIVTLTDNNSGVNLLLHYMVYEDCDVITRYAELVNLTEKSVAVRRLMSSQVDFELGDYSLTSFHGAWAHEMNKQTTAVNGGRIVVSSFTGGSSNRSNPFTMLHSNDATETSGDVYGFNLIYSGNHYTSVEKTGLGHTRVLTGINPANFRWALKAGERFQAPEAVMTYSKNGFTGMSHNMHAFVREHIVRGTWKKKPRPILLNTWEACYFDISEKKLVDMAKEAADLGIELLVMDDGWFGERDSDKTSLGDWTVNYKKLPHGLFGLCRKIKSFGMGLGIWVEPEMVSEESYLYRAHPDWAMKIPGRNHTQGRNQMILDLCNPDVREYIIGSMTDILKSADIQYVKWDMNRIFSDYFSPYLDRTKQGEVAHRYIMGLYEILDNLTKAFPNVLFEGCAAGGNRFDLGILSYFPQIWGSDDTDAMARAKIQTGYSYGYPMSTVTAHVSDVPNHQTLRKTDIETRYAVASMGVLGYECNIVDADDDTKELIKAQVEKYKEWRDVFFFGDIYRQHSNGIYTWTVVSPDKDRAVGIMVNTMVEPNTEHLTYRAAGLNPELRYRFYNIGRKYNIREFGSLINTVSPVHIKLDSWMYNNIAKKVKMDSEVQDYHVYGDALMNAGVKLYQGYVGTGYSDKTRYFGDFAARIYYMESQNVERESEAKIEARLKELEEMK